MRIGVEAQRAEANRTLAFFHEFQGKVWQSLRSAIPEIAAGFSIPVESRKRSDIAIDCARRLVASGLKVPTDYLPPWKRGNAEPLFRNKKNWKQRRSIEFYNSREWRQLRYAVLKVRGRKCECCGCDSSRAAIHVDHIKSLKKHWDLRLDPGNLQVLCEPCNMGKGAVDETDWRKISAIPNLERRPSGADA